MRRLRMIALALGLLALLAAPEPSLASGKAEALPERYRRWLGEDVAWILTEDEKKEFLELKADEERDRFIERFWQLRDPQPLTAENEFRDEHQARVAWANRNLGSDSPRKGCLTERGRVYILLGKPDDVERSVSGNEIYPYEMWFYGRNTARLGLPGQLRLLFYRPFGVGEYRLMNPVIDRDRLFPPSTQIDITSTRLLQELVGPEVSLALDSVAPGEGANKSAEIVQELVQPRRIPERIRDQGIALNPSVRTRFTLVSVELGLASLIVPLDDGSSRVHLGAVLPPSEISFQEVASDRWTCRVDVFGDVTDEKGVVIAKFDEIATLTLAKAELEKRKGHSFAFETVRTLVPGRYRVKLMLQDWGKGRLGRAETTIEVPPAPEPGGAALSPFALASRADRAEGTAGEAPFTFAGFQLLVPPANRFQIGRPVIAFGLLREAPGEVPRNLSVAVDLRSGDKSVFSAEAASPAPTSVAGRRPILVSVPTANLAPGAYRLEVVLRAGATVVASARQGLELTGDAQPAGYFRWSERRSAPPEVEHYNRGIQLLSRGDLTGAEQAFRISLDHRRGFRPSRIQLARVLALAGRTADAEGLLAKVLEEDPDNHDALVTRGSLRLAASDYAAAAAALDRALETGSRTKEVLNALAEAAIGIGDKAKARRCLEESLRIDPQQEAVRKRLAAFGS